jgi:hypothetical protein
MTESTSKKALFSQLIYDENGEPVETTFIGLEPHYVIMDGDFKRHVASEIVDRQVIETIQGHAEANKEIVSEQIMNMLGKNDLFTKAMIDSSIGNMDQVIEQGMPDDARTMLGMMGFKIVVNVHGDVVNLDMPGLVAPDDDDGGEW